jgi:hypothetical protein
MMRLLNKYQQALVWFLTGLLFVVLSTLFVTHNPQISSAEETPESSLKQFERTHKEPNFYDQFPSVPTLGN